jgi:calcium-translocating P-type ATPase
VDISAKKEMSKLYGNKITLIKGAPEIVIKHCFDAYGCDGKRKKLDKNALLDELALFSSKGMRAIAIATSEAEGEALEYAASQIAMGNSTSVEGMFKGGCLVCIALIRDEIRKEAPRAIKNLKSAGVQPIMVTGDSLATAKAIAKETGILTAENDSLALTSDDLKNMSDTEIAKALPSLCVVARALPDDKSRLVRIAKECGYVTAMTGDGLNDAPALRIADVGFAMGNGTDVTKEAGDIIINNNDISSIERAVLYGRTIFRSIRKFIVFQLIMNLSAVGISIIGSFIGFENPVTVTQMLWVNMIMDTLAAIAFAGEAPLDRYMKSPPIPKNEPVLNGDMITRIFVMGVYTVTLCLYYLFSPQIASLFGGRESAEFLSGFFALFVFCGVFGAFTARSGRVNIISGLFANPVFVTVIAAVFCTQVGMIYLGGAALRCAPLSASQMCRVILIALTVIPAGMVLELALKIRMPAVRRTEKSGGT